MLFVVALCVIIMFVVCVFISRLFFVCVLSCCSVSLSCVVCLVFDAFMSLHPCL